jgi:hypothetical protein
LPWNCIAEPREVTRSWLIVASAVVNSSHFERDLSVVS